MRYRLIILSVFWAMLGCVPAFAANDTPEPATETAIEQTADIQSQDSGIEEPENVGEPATQEQMEAAAAALLPEEDRKIVEIESSLMQRGWEDSGHKHRREIFKKIHELKQAMIVVQAQQNYDVAKENEQSLANRTLSATTMAATGIGGMELAMGLAQQKADKTAEADMTAYLSTFQCKVGDKRYKGTDKNIEIPGANQLTKLYQDYVDLAASLKERKAALGLKPGIEAEVVLDKANMGLYDDVGHGIENGTYASLYRASKGNENDIKKLQEDKDAAKKRVIAGAVLSAAGVIAGIVGNLALNGNKKPQDVLAKRQEIEQELAETIQYELEACNIQIQEAKERVAELKQTAEYKTSVALRDYVKKVEGLEYLTNQEDVYKLTDHPVCN